MKDLLVVVDMVNGFINFGALADKKINKITPIVKGLIKKAREKNMDIVAFKDCHSYNDEEFKTYPPHCLRGTRESDLIPELKPYEKYMFTINKNTTNGFNNIVFKSLIKNIMYRRVYVVGCCTDICVKDFTESYLQHIKQNKLKTKIIIIEDACYTFDNPSHNAEEEHKKAINYLKLKGAEIISTKHNETIKDK